MVADLDEMSGGCSSNGPEGVAPVKHGRCGRAGHVRKSARRRGGRAGRHGQRTRAGGIPVDGGRTSRRRSVKGSFKNGR